MYMENRDSESSERLTSRLGWDWGVFSIEDVSRVRTKAAIPYPSVDRALSRGHYEGEYSEECHPRVETLKAMGSDVRREKAQKGED
jgi:hypothetical protein